MHIRSQLNVQAETQAEVETISEADDLKNANAQNKALMKAKVPLAKVVQDAVAANPGYRAVSVVPMAKSGSPMAEITLMKGETVKNVSTKLD
jgi:transcription antitermination factor NusA-like protein